jgi:hypothetical protein
MLSGKAMRVYRYRQCPKDTFFRPRYPNERLAGLEPSDINQILRGVALDATQQVNKSAQFGISNQATAKLNAENKNATQRRDVFDLAIREEIMLSLPFCSGLSIPVFYTSALLEYDPLVCKLVLSASGDRQYNSGNATRGGSVANILTEQENF